MKEKNVSTMEYTNLMLADYCDGCKEIDISTNYLLTNLGVCVVMLSCDKRYICEKLYNELKRKENGVSGRESSGD